MISPLESSNAVISYLSRVNAKIRTLFTAAVTTVSMGYERDVHVIRFNRDGSVRSPEAISPTPTEALAIAKDIAEMEFPYQQTLAALSNSDLPPLIRDATQESLFIFRNLEGRIRFIQVRVELENGDKRYVPQTYWSDGKWRAVEPEDGLPIYGIEKVQNGDRVFLHEGAKAAKAATKIAEDPSHPFHDYFSNGVHVGWIGGAHHINRTLWREMSRLPGELIIVPDNDFVGRMKVSQISQRFNCPVYAFMLDSEWPKSWDVADPIPSKFVSDKGLYIGPSFESLLESCDWATRQIGATDNGRPIYAIREEFAAKWVRIQNLRHYALIAKPEDTLDRDQFNTKIMPYSDVTETSLLLSRVSGNICDKVTFMPNKPSGIIRLDGYTCLNQYVDRRLKPIKGDTKPFHEFLNYLLPIAEERQEILRWIATIYSKPETRIGYGLLLLSKLQGVGKSTLLDIMGELIGKQHTSYPGDAMIQSDFNGWIVNRRLVIVHEIYAGQNWKTYNRLKSLITDNNVEANNKHVSNYTVPNWTQFAAASNSLEALRMEHDDRRWFVPRLPETLYYDYRGLQAWMSSGGIRHLAEELLKHNNYILPGEIAPRTAAKEALIDQSMPADERMVVMLCERLKSDNCLDVRDIWLWLQAEAKGRAYVTPQRISSLLKENGYQVDQPDKIGSRMRQIIWVDQKSKLAALQNLSGEQLHRKVVERLKEPSDVFGNDASM